MTKKPPRPLRPRTTTELSTVRGGEETKVITKNEKTGKLEYLDQTS